MLPLHTGYKQDTSRNQASYQGEETSLTQCKLLSGASLGAENPLSHSGVTGAVQVFAKR